MVPYLNGLHMTIDGWRAGRDSEGWKLPRKTPRSEPPKPKRELDESKPNFDESGFNSDEFEEFAGPGDTLLPTEVAAVPRLYRDIAALQSLCNTENPPWRRVRPKHSASVLYGFGDASGSAFGATSQFQSSNEVHFEYGQWIASATEEESSNWREFTNVVEYLEGLGAAGKLDDCEVFMFTDNSTTDAAFWKGNSHSRKLCDLVLRLRQLEMRTGMTLHIVHVSGKRMIAQGTDGLSRGDHSTGVMSGSSILSFVPLHLTALERSSSLKPWLESLLEGLDPHFLSPDDWFSQTNQEGTFVWTPAPAAADAVVERLGIARHKRPNTLHLLLIPRLMTGRWRKHLLKSIDCYSRILSPPLWDMKSQFEPLLMFVAFPFTPDRPRLAERKSLYQRFDGILREDPVQQIHTGPKRDLLRKLFVQAGSLRSL
jgi:hypothetical protein